MFCGDFDPPLHLKFVALTSDSYILFAYSFSKNNTYSNAKKVEIILLSNGEICKIKEQGNQILI